MAGSVTALNTFKPKLSTVRLNDCSKCSAINSKILICYTYTVSQFSHWSAMASPPPARVNGPAAIGEPVCINLPVLAPCVPVHNNH